MTDNDQDTSLAPTSRVTLGLLWSILAVATTGILFLWARFDSLDDKFVTREVFNERTMSIEKRIDDRTDSLQKQIERLEAAIERQSKR